MIQIKYDEDNLDQETVLELSSGFIIERGSSEMKFYWVPYIYYHREDDFNFVDYDTPRAKQAELKARDEHKILVGEVPVGFLESDGIKQMKLMVFMLNSVIARDGDRSVVDAVKACIEDDKFDEKYVLDETGLQCRIDLPKEALRVNAANLTES